MSRWNVCVTVCALCVLISGARADFQDGDLYLISAVLPNANPPPSTFPGILKVDPLTGATELLTELSPSFSQRAATYDPYRDRLVVKVGAAGTSLILVDSAGVITPLPTTFTNAVQDIAAAGDGRIYMLNGGAIPYITVDGMTRTVYESDGVTPFNPNLTAGLGQLIFDADNNALIIVDISSPGMRVRSVPLSLDGSRIDGVISEVLTDLVSGAGEIAVGMNEGPGGDVFLKVDDNSNSLQPRMQLIDPDTLVVQTYASSEYFGVGGEVAGCYSSVRDQAVVLDSFSDVLKVYSFGASGDGATLSTSVSAGGSGEIARIIEIGGSLIGTSPLFGDINGDNAIDDLDHAALCAALGSMTGDANYDPAADLNNDGFVDLLDQQLMSNVLVPCAGDVVTSATFQPPADGVTDGADLAFQLGAWGTGPSCADFVTSATLMPPPDGVVDGADLAYLLGGWGMCP